MKRYLLSLVAILLLPVAMFAQGTTSGSIEGTVVDTEGEPLAGANVVAIHQPTGTRYGTATRPNGRYSFNSVRVGGPYEIQVTFVGFNANRKEIANIELGETSEINFTLEEGEMALEEISVVAQADPVFNSDRTGASTNISEQEIDATPTISRSLGDFTRLSPQVTSGNSFGGANARYNNILVDGATLNDVFGLSDGGTPGGGAGVSSPISIDAIEEFNVDIAPYDVTNNNFTGGQVNAITKSGTNTFTGSAYYQMRNESFIGNYQYNRFGETNTSEDYPEFTEKYLGINLGGPIIEDELFFFINGEFSQESSPLTTGISGSGAVNEFPLGASTFDEIKSIAQNQYDYNPGGYDLITPSEDNYKIMAKLDWNINNDHKFTLRYNRVDGASESGVDRYSNSYSFDNSLYDFKSVQNSLVAELNSTFGNNMSNTFRAVYTRVRDFRDVQGEEFPYVNISLQGGDAGINMGVEQYSQANRLDQDLLEITDNFTYVRGDHTFKVGTSNQIFTFDNLFVRNAYGTYEFRSVGDWRDGDPYAYNHSYLREDGSPTANFTGIQFGLYAQDKWSVTDYLKLTMGLRADMPVMPEKLTNNPQVEQSFPGYSTSEVASGNILWSPRIGFNWDASQGERTTQIRGGAGIFSGNPPFVWISNQYSNTGVDYGRIEVQDYVDDDGNYVNVIGDGFFEPNPDQQPSPRTGANLPNINTTEVNLTSEDFKYPQSLKFNLGIDQELPFGVVGTLEGIYSSVINEVKFRNINLVNVGETAHGRPLYGDVYDAGFGSASGSPERVDGQNFTDVILLENTDKGYQYSITGELEKNFDSGLSASLAYTYNRSETTNIGTSDQARSSWIYNYSYDINNPALGPAQFERRHRILGQFAYQFNFLDRFATTISLIYDGRSGTPFSWTYTGDANGDGEFTNDLIYVPESQDEVEMASGNWDEFNNWIESTESVNRHRGSFAERGSAREPWTNFLDLRINQRIDTFGGQSVELTASIFNVLNVLNDSWGVNESLSTGYTNYPAVTILEYNDQDIPVIEFDPDNVTDDALYNVNDYSSRWKMQLGVKYNF